MAEEEVGREAKEDPWRLTYHLMPPVGWMNDPNGLCQYQGEYHVFFQYAPFEAEGGLKFWGHYKSRDMVSWEYPGTALYADQPFDCHGVYSGSALVEDGQMHLFYTGNVKHTGDFDYVNSGRSADTVHVSSKDGLHFGPKEVVIDSGRFPGNCTCHVRDPKVWKEGSRYWMVQGARRKGEEGVEQDRGEILVYSSEDMRHWEPGNRITSGERFGYMWECPDFFRLNGHQFLLCCPQGVEQDHLEHQNLYQNGYFPLEGSIEAECRIGSFQTLDYGFDFYAPQTFQDDRGRRILIGWAGMPDVDYRNPTVAKGWQHCMTVPRVLTEREGKLLQNPVPELWSLRRNERVLLTDGTRQEENLSAFEAWMEWEGCRQVRIRIEDGANGAVTLEYQADSGIAAVTLEGELAFGRDRRNVPLDRMKNLRILGDTSILEFYFNDGEKVLTTRYYPEGGKCKLCVEAENGNGKIWDYSFKKK